MKVLVLCHGNINRSPAAAAVLARFKDLGVRSAGFREGGERASKKMREAMSARGYDLSAHRSRRVTREDVDWAERILVMDNGNARRFVAEFPDIGPQYLGLWAIPPVAKIPDPVFLPRGPEFERVVDLIVQAARNFGIQQGRDR